MNNSDRGTGVLLVLTAAVFWSFSGVSVKSMPDVNPLLITGYRSLFTFILILAYYIFVSGGLSAAGQTARRALGFRRAWGSASCYSLMLVLFISATHYTTAANAILLQYAAPMYVALLSFSVLKEPVRPREWLALSGCLVGVLMFFGEKLSADGLFGNILAILSGITCALNTVFMRSLTKIDDGITPVIGSDKRVSLAFPAVILGNLLTVLVCLPWMADLTMISARFWGILVFLGFIQLGLPYILFTIGIARLGAVEVMILAMAEAVLNPVWVAVFAKEIPSTTACFGGMMILASIGVYGWMKHHEGYRVCAAA
jgi:drug/metabolite transporter (DMT)-like permease